MRIALYFHGGCLNRGNEAILRGTLPLLQTAFPGAEATLYDLFPQEDLAAGLPDWVTVTPLFPAKMPTISKFSVDRLRLSLYSRESQEKADEFFFGKVFAYSDILEHDLFLSVGGDNYCYDSVSAIAALNRKISEAGKPAVLWGASVGAEDLTPQKEADLRRYTRITVRESRTLALLDALGLGERCSLHADPAFLLEPEPCALPAGFVPGATVGLNLSDFALQGSRKAMAAAKALVEQLLAEPGASVALIPHVLRPGSDDRACLRPLLEGTPDGRVFLLSEGEDWSAAQLKYAISRCRALIGARTHATIAAYSTGVPVLALGYSVKATGIAEDLFGSAKGLVLPVNELTPENLCTTAAAFLDRATELRETLEAQLPARKASAASAVQRLLDIDHG
ncbi:MAG: polysaccharide pyruvyl transferase family protein [Oscillospiraceae bacterium]|jgi:polysaccharide pyruvyl transferase WcaK-like protein|nr:polysaccharide pyruvyl transferase family protein [Oscillospiraceae bacterium]